MRTQKTLITLLFAAVLASCTTSKKTANALSEDFVKENFSHAATMLNGQLKVANEKFEVKNGAFPRTADKNGKLVTTSMYDWTPGFFPGSLWYAYEYSKDEALKAEAVKWTEKLLPLQHFTEHHDLGFMMYCSYGNAYRLANKPEYKNILINSAKALSTRFNETAGCIKSWNRFVSWHENATYYFPVIIDNMMNLEMLFFASRVSGDETFRKIAIKHAETTMQNHFRPDYSSYHVVCYDSATGKVMARETAQGYADNSTWSRGQAWAVYGYTMVYRETKDPRFLKFACGLADYFINNKNMPADGIPYWDFNANEAGYTPGGKSNANNIKIKYRDASAAAITTSALLELSTYTKGKDSEKYKNAAVKMLQSLGSDTYRAKPGTNADFILKHSVGSIPHDNEIDVPLVYADYYFLEALLRYERLAKGQSLF
ncbi:MAG TPA: glycoside hydrolase family 88 protein [Niabella sp.]|nr:glycoside hydrolase family 88 protein [Niabella sp.]